METAVCPSGAMKSAALLTPWARVQSPLVVRKGNSFQTANNIEKEEFKMETAVCPSGAMDSALDF